MPCVENSAKAANSDFGEQTRSPAVCYHASKVSASATTYGSGVDVFRKRQGMRVFDPALRMAVEDGLERCGEATSEENLLERLAATS
jgi:hypothetical protein